jgi:hypothetical protein
VVQAEFPLALLVEHALDARQRLDERLDLADPPASRT